MTPSTHFTSAVADFAAGVRTALNDLPADEVDELTDGLEADLLDQAADSGSGTFTPDDPAAYAAELRAAAGLPPRQDSSSKNNSFTTDWRSALASVTEWRRRTAAAIRTRPGGAATLDLLVTLRPLWWFARGWVLAQVLVFFLGISPGWVLLPFGNPATTLVFVAAIVVSVQWGRGRWLPWTWLRGLKILVSAGAIIAIPVLGVAVGSVSYALSSASAYETGLEPTNFGDSGLVSNGVQVTNIFVYDAEGNPIENAQLFTQDGSPLTTVSDGQYENYLSSFDPETGEESFLVPSDAVPGSKGWNVFPLASIDAQLLYQEEDWESAVPTLPRLSAPAPFATVRPVALDRLDEGEGSRTAPESTTAPQSSAKPKSTPSPSATPSTPATPTPTASLGD